MAVSQLPGKLPVPENTLTDPNAVVQPASTVSPAAGLPPAGGLLNSVLPPVGDAPPPPAPVVPREIQPAETVSGQMEGLLAQNSPYMQAATTNANAAVNARGLLSSSLGVGAAQKAAIESAMPMALQDSTIAANSALTSQQTNENLARDTQAQKAQKDLAQMGMTVDWAKLDQTSREAMSRSMEANHQQLTVALAKIDTTPDAEMSADSKIQAKDFLMNQYKLYVNTQSALFAQPVTWDKPPLTSAEMAAEQKRRRDEAAAKAAEQTAALTAQADASALTVDPNQVTG